MSQERGVSSTCVYVVSEFRLPRNAFVIHNLDINLSLDYAVRKCFVDYQVGKSPETLQAALSENAALREKLVEASALIANYASTIQQMDFRVEKINYKSALDRSHIRKC